MTVFGMGSSNDVTGDRPPSTLAGIIRVSLRGERRENHLGGRRSAHAALDTNWSGLNVGKAVRHQYICTAGVEMNGLFDKRAFTQMSSHFHGRVLAQKAT